MKKRICLLLACFSAFALVLSCAKGIGVWQEEKTPSPDGVSVQNSLEKLALALPAEFSENPAVRSGGKRIGEIFPFTRLSVFAPATRSVSGGREPLESIYVVNYADEEGFAILSTDPRMQDVLAYSDRGSISDTMSNPGMRLFLERIPDYAMRALAVNGDIFDTIPSWGGGGGGDFPPIYTLEKDTTSFGPWSGTCIGPLIPVKWGQGWPFNNETPICSTSVTGNHMPAGCVATAMMQILAYYRKPDVIDSQLIHWDILVKHFIHGTNFTFPGNTLCDLYTEEFIHELTNEIAHVFRHVGDLTEMSYGCEGSGSDIHKAKVAFNRIETIQIDTVGYFNEGIKTFTFDRAKEDLLCNRPVYMTGHPKGENGHAWVVDGYRYQSRVVNITTHYYTAIGHEYVKSEDTQASQSRHHFHHNWGWDGLADGWFAPMVFNPSKVQEMDDSLKSYTGNTDYDKDIKMIKNLHYVAYRQ